jgi:hypothetical protein
VRNEEALAHQSQALELAPEMDRERRYRLPLCRSGIYDLLGRRDEQRQDLAESEVLAEGLGSEQQDQPRQVPTTSRGWPCRRCSLFGCCPSRCW